MTASAAAGRPGPHLELSLQGGTGAKAVASLVLGAIGLYFLHIGNRDKDPRRLAWSLAFFFACLGVLLR